LAVAVNVTGVGTPLHSVVTFDDNAVGAVGGVTAEMDTVTPPVVVALHAPVPFSRTQHVVAAFKVTASVPADVVDGDSWPDPIVLPTPHSYTAPEPVLPTMVVNTAGVVTPLHTTGTFDNNPVGAVGGVNAEMDTVTPPVVVALHAPVPFSRTQYVMAAFKLTVRVLAVMVAGDITPEPTVAPVPHSYTAPEPTLAVAVKVAGVVVPLHIAVTFDDNPVGVEGGVTAEMDAVTPPVVVALHTPVPFMRTQYVVAALGLTE
jgi:beta-phosphoglucomutase-like phosphatase (HAD superfamily)